MDVCRNPAKNIKALVGIRKKGLSVLLITEVRFSVDKAHEYEGVLIANDEPVRRLGGLKDNLNPKIMDSALETKEVKR
jgi:hypothetical protein